MVMLAMDLAALDPDACPGWHHNPPFRAYRLCARISETTGKIINTG